MTLEISFRYTLITAASPATASIGTNGELLHSIDHERLW